MTEKTLLILHGPLTTDPADADGQRELALERIRSECEELCAGLGISLELRQTDEEDRMLGWIASDSQPFDALIISPARTVDPEKFRSALEAMARPGKPVIEIHEGNIFREGGAVAKPLQGPEKEMGFVCGLGLHGYRVAIRAAAERLRP